MTTQVQNAQARPANDERVEGALRLLRNMEARLVSYRNNPEVDDYHSDIDFELKRIRRCYNHPGIALYYVTEVVFEVDGLFSLIEQECGQ